MTLARFIVGSHDPKCSGCPACSEAMAALLRPLSAAVPPPPPSLADAIRRARGLPAPVPTVALPVRPAVHRAPPETVPSPPSLADRFRKEQNR